MPADVQTAGATTAPAHTLYDIVRKLPDGSQVELDYASDSQSLTIRAGRSRFMLGCLPVEDFPSMAGGELPHRFELAANELRAMIERTRFAISTEETRYYLNGIYLHAAGEGQTAALRAVATDGHRLARVEMALPQGAEGLPGVIVPRKTVGEIYKLIEENAEPVTIDLSDAKIRFAFDSVTLTSKLIDGTFPDYERVIPADNDRVLEVEAKDFSEAVDRVSTISSEKSRAVKLSLADGSLTLSVSAADQGSATEALEVGYDAEAMEIGFNARYLMDITDQIEGAKARFLLADAASPTIIRDSEDDSALYVLMPMRV